MPKSQSSREQLLARVEAGKRAAEVLELVSDETEPRFWEVLAERSAAKLGKVLSAPPEPELPPLSDEQAARVGATYTMRYGKFMGELWQELPLWYLASVTDPPDDEQKLLKRYARWRRERRDE